MQHKNHNNKSIKVEGRELTTEEFHTWLMNNVSTDQEKQVTRRLWNEAEGGDTMDKESTRRIWENLQHRTAKRPSKGRTVYLKQLQRVAAILFIPLLIASLFMLYNANRFFDLENAVAELRGAQQTVYAPLGGKLKVQLPDGSTVWLNAGSKLTYPTMFAEQSRDITLEGEGFFKVQTNKNKPMIINTTGIDVKVYGTTFNLKAYPDEERIWTQLVEGKVSMKRHNSTAGKEHFLKPGHEGVYYSDLRKFKIQPIDDLSSVGAWIDDKLIFKKEEFGTIFKALERHYNVKIEVADPTLLKDLYDAAFQGESIQEVLEIFAYSQPIIYKIHKRERQPNGFYGKQKITIKRDKTRR
ncbi:FecR family protein [Puteibacter caeruleilacunae]|nr:FecR family protein [Puteibacter caeruleilacunae]